MRPDRGDLLALAQEIAERERAELLALVRRGWPYHPSEDLRQEAECYGSHLAWRAETGDGTEEERRIAHRLWWGLRVERHARELGEAIAEGRTEAALALAVLMLSETPSTAAQLAGVAAVGAAEEGRRGGRPRKVPRELLPQLQAEAREIHYQSGEASWAHACGIVAARHKLGVSRDTLARLIHPPRKSTR